MYKSIVATDTSEKQLEYATALPNVTYKCTPPNMTMHQLQTLVGKESTFDLITVAQAMHWFDLPAFYAQAKWLLKKPDGVIAAWCYTSPRVNATFDALFDKLYYADFGPYMEKRIRLVDEEYRTIDFPFQAVDGGGGGTGPLEFRAEKEMDLEGLLTMLKSWSPYQTAKDKGVELLGEDVVQKLRRAWNENGEGHKLVGFPVFLRIGKVGTEPSGLHG